MLRAAVSIYTGLDIVSMTNRVQLTFVCDRCSPRLQVTARAYGRVGQCALVIAQSGSSDRVSVLAWLLLTRRRYY